MRALATLAFAVTLALGGSASARAADGPTRRFAVVAGASLGGRDRVPLRYATSDARDVARVLRRLGGVALDDLVIVEEPDADRLRTALRALAGETQRTQAAGRRVELFVYYSGHSDEQGLLLGETRLEYAELRRELDRVPADVRVAILDSCASGAITRAKGGVHQPPFVLDASSRVEGHAFLTSSAAGEAAQESDRLRASFFTHALLTGLRGAADTSGDGVVTLNEAYQFAFRETLASTEASQGGPQHATYDIGLVGSGDVVMTDLRRADGILVIPEPVDGRVFVRNGSGVLVAELRKARGSRIELALEEGRYDVRVVREKAAAGATITLASNDRVVLDEARLWPVPLEATAARGPVPAGPAEVVAAPPPAFASAPSAVAAAGAWPAPESRVVVRGGVAASLRPKHPRGLQVELAAEAWRWGFVGIEASAGYSLVSGDTEGRLPVATWLTSQVHDEVTTVPVLLTLKLGLPGDGPVRPYLLGGTGVTYVRVKRTPAEAYPSSWQSSAALSAEDLFVSLHCGAGLAARLSRDLRLTVDARLSFGSARVLQERMSMQQVQLLAGVGFSF